MEGGYSLEITDALLRHCLPDGAMLARDVAHRCMIELCTSGRQGTTLTFDVYLAEHKQTVPIGATRQRTCDDHVALLVFRCVSPRVRVAGVCFVWWRCMIHAHPRWCGNIGSASEWGGWGED